MKISNRAKAMAPSATLVMAAKAAKMRAEGINVISFATGEPDFDTPSLIKKAAKKALDEGFTKYPPSAGLLELKKTVCEKLLNDNKLQYSPDEIVVTCGAKQAIYNALQVLIDEGDEVIIPAPYWVSYPEQVKLAGGKPVIVPADNSTSFKLTPEKLVGAINNKTRAILINTPSNPSGSAYTKEELARLCEILVKNNVAIISDEIYEKLVYDNFKHTSVVEAFPACRDLTIIINGVSKAYAMTGWRVGYAAGPKEIISKITSMVGQQITGIPPFVQMAAIEALRGPQTEIEEMRKEFRARRDLMLEKMSKIPNIKCHIPEGAFYLLPNIEFYIGKKINNQHIDNATALANYLLDSSHIATVSGDPFGAPGHIRFSYATSRENIEEGMRRFAEALKKL